MKITKDSPYTGLYLDYKYEPGRLYTLTYEIEAVDGEFKTIGGHAQSFGDKDLVVKKRDGTIVASTKNGTVITDINGVVTRDSVTLEKDVRYFVIESGRFYETTDDAPWLWI
jgi:hypothetical protein